MTSMRKSLLVLIAASLLGAGTLAAQSAPAKPSDPSQQVPSISADRGDCSADFTVVDNGKPVYQASIRALVRWGLAHKTDLTVSTNYYGKAQFTRLPNYSKKPVAFEVSAGDKKSTVLYNPDKDCKGEFKVELK